MNFNWREESTKRGVANVVSGIFAIVGIKAGIDADTITGIIASGQAFVGILGALRADK